MPEYITTRRDLMTYISERTAITTDGDWLTRICDAILDMPTCPIWGENWEPFLSDLDLSDIAVEQLGG